MLSPLKALIESGDKVISVEGILSGTLSYIFNTWQLGTPFSDVVLKAKELGYTEPDPREDLSGTPIPARVHAHRLIGLILALVILALLVHKHSVPLARSMPSETVCCICSACMPPGHALVDQPCTLCSLMAPGPQGCPSNCGRGQKPEGATMHLLAFTVQ